MSRRPLLTMELRYEEDCVLCRQRVRQVGELLGFDRQDQTRLLTAASEILRNALEYARGGKVELSVDDGKPQSFVIAVRDSGPGIADLKRILDGRYESKTGMGLGILGARRLMDSFEIESVPGAGTRITLSKALPDRTPGLTAAGIRKLVDELASKGPQTPFQEIQEQNQELLRAMDELQERKLELERLNRELEETNRGVVALYAELDEKADSLKRASEAKTSFLSNMTHELRTPLNSIISLSRATLSGEESVLHPEHQKQISYIQKSAEQLSELVNDLLDIAKVEAGKIDVRPAEFAVGELVGGLRAVLKPIAALRSEVGLQFEDTDPGLTLMTDEGKVAQILRNLVSNALKYTERGGVRVSARADGEDWIRFEVEDTGIGIGAADHERVFEEFVQVDSSLQRKSKGTGLGLSLSRKLARLLGGEIVLQSEPGHGSLFTLILPRVFGTKVGSAPAGLKSDLKRVQRKVLIIDDEEISRYLLKELLTRTSAEVTEATDGFDGIRKASNERPDVIFLDLQMPAMSGFYVLDVLKANANTQAIPVVIHTAMILTPQERSKLEGQAVAILSKSTASREEALAALQSALDRALRAGTVPPAVSERLHG